MASTAVSTTRFSGGSFLIEDRTPAELFTPEDFTEQHLLIAQTAEDFAVNEIVPNIEKMELKDIVIGKGDLTVGRDQVELSRPERVLTGGASLFSFLARTMYFHVIK